MRLAERLNRVEQTVQTKMQALTPSESALVQRGLRVRRMLDYVGLPADDDNGMAGRRLYETRIAQIMLTTGCDRPAAIVRQYAESHGLTEDGAREWLGQLCEVGRATERDIESGIPFEASQAGARLKEKLTSGPNAQIC